MSAVVTGASALLGAYLGVALMLIASQRPRAKTADAALDFDALQGAGPQGALRQALARDGMPLSYRRFEGAGPAAPLLILVHGSGWHGGAYCDLAETIAASGVAEVIVPDLRGHGPSPLRRGDVDHVGQLEEDLCDLIHALGGPARKVWMLGHSSGGGLVVRFAGGPFGGMLSKAVLMAPFLQCDAPTTRRGQDGWARPLARRIIGISMLDKVGITALHGLQAISFAFPRRVLDGPGGGAATAAYSYRLNASFSPRRDYLADIAALPEFCVIVGGGDAVFVPEAYAPLMAPANPRGTYRVLPGLGHLGIIRAPQAAAAAIAFLQR